MPLKALSRSTPSRYQQRGNAMVETALVILPFFAIVLGIIDYGRAFYTRTALQYSVQAGTRYAVTFQTLDGMCQDASIKEIVRRSSVGMLNAEDVNNRVFVRYYKPDTLALTASNLPGNIVEVSIEGYQLNWIAPLWRSAIPMTVLARSSDRMEGLPGGSSGPPCR
ncbi:TadE/TadG family type IV pilus assembly protein [uncultured Paludibaculum sp.]|uniref:TadE/TadG family type IV pilus assembly protein n=1 Tax=uncultured Paludibaculum sp. TaxID=1765020 RepID=UPI002AAC31FE|nr:TadE/TadG family type IV pilus assembly protein [uncultured Paludibaculum sp.]